MLLDLLVYLLHLLFAHPFFYMAAFVVFVIGSAIVSKKDAKVPKIRSLYIFGFFFIFINFFVGHYINASLIHWAGEKGVAKITDSYDTGVQYNRHNVDGYHVLIRTPQGKIVETSFEDDDFNVYPYHNTVTYPPVGIEFHVSYLKHFPTAFVIIANDDSPWANERHCIQLKNNYAEAMNKYSFDRSNLQYRKACITAIQNIIRNHCYTDSTDLKKYYGDMDYVNRGKAFDY